MDTSSSWEPNAGLDRTVQQILARMRARIASAAPPVIPQQQPAPQPSYQPQPQTAYAPQPAPYSGYQPQQAAPDPAAAMQGMPLFPAPPAPPAAPAAPAAPSSGDWSWAHQFVPGGVPDYARDYYAEMIAKGRGNEGTDGYYNDSGSTSYNHMYSPDGQ